MPLADADTFRLQAPEDERLETAAAGCSCVTSRCQVRSEGTIFDFATDPTPARTDPGQT